MSSRDDQRTDRRTPPCEVVIPPPLPAREPTRPEIPCTPTTPPEVDVFFQPTPPPFVPAPFATIGPVLVGPDTITATCAELSTAAGFIGDSVTLDSTETVKRSFLWQTIPNITEAQLTFLSQLNEADRNTVAAGTMTEAEIATVFQLQLSQAIYVRLTIAEMSEEAYLASKERAIGRLDCRFWNDAQTASCGGGALSVVDGQSVVNTYTVPAGTFSSTDSVEEANAIALMDAQSRLECWWGNVAITRKCSQVPGSTSQQIADYAELEAVKPPEEEFLADKPERVTRRLSATVAANVITSNISQEDANNQAELEAFSQLVCFFTAPATMQCALDADGVAATGPTADVFARTPGKTVNVPEGLTQSITSQEDAEVLAEVFAAGLLECLWLNRAITVSCDDDPAMAIADHLVGDYEPVKKGQLLFSTAYGLPIEMFASSDRGIYTLTIAAGECIATLEEGGRAAAEEQAIMLARAQLNCVYCNPEIPPVCVPDYDPETQELPLLLDPEDADLSLDATTGIPGVKYEKVATGNPSPNDFIMRPVGGVPHGVTKIFICTDSANEALAVADTVGVIPVKSNSPQERNSQCRYTNEPLTLTCASLIASGTPSLPSYVLHPTSLTKEVNVPAGQYQVFLLDGETPAEARARATLQARAYAETILFCEFGNPRLVIKCGADGGEITTMAMPTESEYASGVTDSWVGDGHFGINNDMVASASNGSPSKPIVIPRNALRSTLGWRDAVQQAFDKADSKLNCFFIASATSTCVPQNDDRPMMSDRRPNTGVWGAPTHPAGSILPGGVGQKAYFKYSGPVNFNLVGGEWVRVVNPGTALPTATAGARSITSQDDADEQAASAAQAQLDCTHINWPRINKRCPRNGDVLLNWHTSLEGTSEGTSTKDANIAAEQIARDMTVCEACAPHRLTTFDVLTGSSWETRLKFCPGSVTFWNLYGGQGGAAAKLRDCYKRVADGLTIKHDMFWQSCGTSLSSMPDTVGPGVWLYWLKIQCCSSSGSQKPSVILIQESEGTHGYSKGEVLPDPDQVSTFYPTERMAKKSAEDDAIYAYVGAIVVDTDAGEDGRRSHVIQHTDENLRISGELGGRFNVLGLVDNGTGVRISPGVVNYVELRRVKTGFAAEEDEEEPPKKILKGIVPTVEGTKINDASAPTLGLTGSNAAIWLICQDNGCSSAPGDEADEPERIEATAKGSEPDAADGEVCILLAEFDIQGDSGEKHIANLITYQQSDWTQYFGCDGIDSSGSSLSEESAGSSVSEDSDLWSSQDSNSDEDSDSIPDSQDSVDDSNTCKFTCIATVQNFPDRWPYKLESPNGCFAKKFPALNVKYSFKFNDPEGSQCYGYVFSMTLDGGKTIGVTPSAELPLMYQSTEVTYVRLSKTPNKSFTLAWKLDNPVPCGPLAYTWSVEVLKETDTASSTDKTCCGDTYGPGELPSDKYCTSDGNLQYSPAVVNHHYGSKLITCTCSSSPPAEEP